MDGRRFHLFFIPAPLRKSLPHEVPIWVDPQKEIYFITINCAERGTNTLACPETAKAVFDSARRRQELHLWWPHLLLLMPDHLHALVSFPPGPQPMQRVVSKFKAWTRRHAGVIWQRDFFEHRLRAGENRREKANYILHNPVRKGLVSRTDEWPYIYFAERQNPFR